MSYQANGIFIQLNENYENKIIEHWDVDNLLFTANGKVGIGTNDPQKKLHVNGNIRAKKKICLVNNEGSDETCITTDNGNLGIGTNDPQKKLDVNGNIRAKKICLVNNEGSDETCIDYSIALLTTEMLKSVMPNGMQDLNQLNLLDSTEIVGIIDQINEDDREENT